MHNNFRLLNPDLLHITYFNGGWILRFINRIRLGHLDESQVARRSQSLTSPFVLDKSTNSIDKDL